MTLAGHHMLLVRDLKAEEIPFLRDFPPAEWKVDLPSVFRAHFGQPYFLPFAAEFDGILAGCANGLVHGHAGWLGNIIVRPEWRGRGIGTVLTQRLVDSLRDHGVQHQILVATSMGEPVYRKLGFQVASSYVFFETGLGALSLEHPPAVRPCQPPDEQSVLALDRSITDEDRPGLLRRFLGDAWVHAAPAGDLDGYYLPGIGTGLVIAANDEAGLALMQHKLSLGAQSSVVPEANTAAISFLLAHGFVESSRAPRMVLGGDVRWCPERVYCRGSGYCG